MIIKLTNQNFVEEISNGLVLVDFYADWCGPCKMLEPILEEISKEMSIKIIQVNINKYEDIARSYQIMSIPNLILFKDGKAIKQNLGFMPKINLINWLNN